MYKPNWWGVYHNNELIAVFQKSNLAGVLFGNTEGYEIRQVDIDVCEGVN